MSLPLTGERTGPGLARENYWLRRHEVAYRAAADLCVGRRVLDAGAGEGYGAAGLRAAGARTVVALDYDPAAADHISRAYAIPTVRGNLVALPFDPDAFDVVVSLQTVEHLWDQRRFVADCARVLTAGGQLVVSTPNRRTFPPGNLFHTRELDAAELTDLITAAGLRIESLNGVHHRPRLTAHGDIVSAQLTCDPQRWPDELTRLVESVTVDDFVLAVDDIDSSLDLYLVASRP